MTVISPSSPGLPESGLPPVAELPIISTLDEDDVEWGVPTRRTVLRTGLLASAALAIGNALTFSFSARPAGAELPPYETHPTHNLFGSGAGSGCLSDQGCQGAPADRIDQGYCATVSDWAANPSWNWHRYYFTGVRGDYWMWDSEDVCDSRDAWNHTGQACGYCSQQIHLRCQDGYKAYQNNQAQRTLCHGISQCNGIAMGGNCGSSC